MPPSLESPFIALVGPPNCGKTTLFNALTGNSNHAVNYPGATVEYSVGKPRRGLGLDFPIADTPGTYSVFPKSPEEQVTQDILLRHRPRALISVVDGTQLSRHLALTRQLIEGGFPLVVAVTMRDILEKETQKLDTDALSKSLGVPVVWVSSLENEGLAELVRQVHLKAAATQNASPVLPAPWSTERLQQEAFWAKDIADAVLSKKSGALSIATHTRSLDRVFLHPIWGLTLFFAIMAGLFTSIFWVAAPLMDFVTHFFESLANLILTAAPHALWADFLATGVVLSIGAVMAFVPQIMILFLGITVLEDSGYLARAAALIDRPLTRLGLNGRSFVPLLSGYACAIPAMLATRTIPDRKERWLTLFIIPLMSCSARLPVYSLLLAFVFWGQPAWKAGVSLAGIYLLSLFISSAVAALVHRMLPLGEGSFLMMELPFYRRPSLKSVVTTVLLRTEGYLTKAGPAIFAFAVLLWGSTTFPHYDAPTPSEKLNDSYAASAGRLLDPVLEPMGGDWRTGICLIAAFAAREVFVSSLALVLQVSEQDEGKRFISLLGSMRSATRSDGSPLFTTASVIGLILFFMIALQCMATLAVARREFGSWKYPLWQLVSFNVLAYVLSVATVQSLHALGIA